MEDIPDPIVVGVIGAPHGVRGTVRVKATGSGRHVREGAEPLADGFRRRIARVRETPKGLLVDFEGVDSREAASALRGVELQLDRADLDKLEEGEFYVDDLAGLSAVSETDEELGVVSEVFETPAHEVLVVRSEESPKELFVPFTLEHVPEVDLEKGYVVVRPPEEDTGA